MQEWYYHYLVLETVPELMWPMAEERQWFKWVPLQDPSAPSVLPVGHWEECECPEQYANVRNFAIG